MKSVRKIVREKEIMRLCDIVSEKERETERGWEESDMG